VKAAEGGVLALLKLAPWRGRLKAEALALPGAKEGGGLAGRDEFAGELDEGCETGRPGGGG
jgi:hypothetical protein